MPFCDWSVHFGDGVSDSEGEALLDSLFRPNGKLNGERTRLGRGPATVFRGREAVIKIRCSGVTKQQHSLHS